MNNFNHIKHWENRYNSGGNSGAGSYGKDAEAKAKYINNIITQYNIKTINDFGHGDGNQLTYFSRFTHYCGYDVSPTVRAKCISQFTDINKYKFIDHPDKFIKSDLALSLDVIYHIIDLEAYEKYLNTLFSIGKYILIYAVDDNVQGDPHYKARKFTPYIQTQFPNFELIDTQNVIHNHVAMYLYKEL